MSKKGLTLTEVLVASTLIIVIMGATVSFKLFGLSVLNKLRNRTQLNLRAVATMEHIIKNLEKAVDEDLERDIRGFYANTDLPNIPNFPNPLFRSIYLTAYSEALVNGEG